MNMFCEYKNIFGKPNEGIHSYRILNIAIVDLLFTILASIVISTYFNFNVFFVFVVLFIIGIIMHKLFCVDTTITKLFS